MEVCAVVGNGRSIAKEKRKDDLSIDGPFVILLIKFGTRRKGESERRMLRTVSH